MKLWLSLPLLLATACGGDWRSPIQTNSSSAGSHASDSISRIKDTGGGIDTIKTSQRRIDSSAGTPAPGRQGAASAASPKRESSSGEGKAQASTASVLPQQSLDGDDAGPARDAGTSVDAGSMRMMMSVAGMSGAAGMSGSAGAAGTGPLMNTGSCCQVSDKPGCGTPETQACVCALQPSCCTTAWTATCTYVVAQKFCQPGVRECVCGAGMGQWRQPECCAQGWNDTCNSVAINKCNARAGCF